MLLLRRLRPKFARASPHVWLTLCQISSKSVHFRQSYCQTREDRFCPAEYLQYRLFKSIINNVVQKFGLNIHVAAVLADHVVLYTSA